MKRRPGAIAALAALGLAHALAGAQPTLQPPGEAAPTAVERLLQAPYLTEEERAELRVFFGRWTPADVREPARRARAALIAGVWKPELFEHPDVAPEDRAEALLNAGEAEPALEALAGVGSVRASRIRAQALHLLGRYEQADAAIEPIVETLTRRSFADAQEVVEAVRALALRARLEGRPAADYHRMLGMLGQARTELDRLHWPAYLAEAGLLYDKDNRAAAVEAIGQALALNPRSAEALFLRGQLAVDSFDFDTAEQIAARLNALAQLATGEAETFSPLAALIEARRWLRQNEPDRSLEALEPALALHPHAPQALAMQAAAKAQLYLFDEAEQLLDGFDERFPRSAMALHIVGAALAENRQYAAAEAHLKRAIEREHNWPAPIIELGLLYIQWGRDDDALRILDRAVALDPFNVRADNSLTLVRELRTYESLQSEHFIVRYKPGVDRVMAQEMLEPLERIHATVSGLFEHEPAQRTIIEVHPNHRWFAVRITGMPDVHTIAAATGPVIAMEAPKVGPNHQGEYDWMRVVQHEYAHTVTLSRTRNRIPHWFTEAAAVHAENKPRDYETVQLLVEALRSDALFDLQQINIAFVRPEKPTDRAQAYAQGHWMYEFIAERFGASAPLNLMDLYARGVREADAYAQALGLTTDEFLRQFEVWATQQARAWGMLPEPGAQRLLFDELTRSEEGRAEAQAAVARIARGVAHAAAGTGMALPVRIDLPEPTEEMADRWLAQHPENPAVLEIKLALAMDRLGDDAPALVPLLVRYARARPVDDMPHRRLAAIYLASDVEAERAKAIPHLDYLDTREQRTPTYAVELARLYAAAGDLDRARAKIERATRIAPFDATIREQAAALSIQGGRLADAERHIAALVEIEPDRSIHKRRLERIQEIRAQRGAS